MELVISFDDTGSMYSVRAQVRQKCAALVKQLFGLDKDIRIGIIIHNDYCDKDTIQHLDLTNNIDQIISFINKSSSCGGGDSDECYELAISYFHNRFSWKSDKKVAILIGDCEPHKVGYKFGKITNYLDWKKELESCTTKGIKVYPVQALGRSSSNYFYDGISTLNNAPKLDLAQFSHIIQFITAIIYNEHDKLDEYENSNAEFKTNNSLKRMFGKLRGLIIEESKVSSGKVTSTKDEKLMELESRFQVLDVGPDPKIIKDFVEENGATFKKGRGFYEFILTETIQENKEVLMVDKATGEIFSDTKWCRDELGLPLGTRGRLNPRLTPATKKYNIFIQSTSYNRKLDPNTKFLYELEHK